MANGKAGAPLGNRNAAKPRLFVGALRRALSEAGQDREILLEIAKKLLDLALEGDLSAMTIIRDTLDGKPAQALHLSGEDGGPVQVQGLAPIYGLQPTSET